LSTTLNSRRHDPASEDVEHLREKRRRLIRERHGVEVTVVQVVAVAGLVGVG